jgi:pimeloyl-ACP methyl ester carboxylesterase
MVSIVLVHGGFVDGSGWNGVYQILRKAGHPVTVVQNPTISHADDVAVTKRALDQQPDQAVLVGHSYGGAVITEAGNHPKVAALVYIAAFAPDSGESVNTLIADPPPNAPVPPILPPQDGFLFLDKDKFAGSFAADVDPDLAAFMADSQVPWGIDALGWCDHRAGVAEQAELVPRHDRGQDDPTGCAALHVGPRQCDGGRDRRQSCRLRVEPRTGGGAHRDGREGRQLRQSATRRTQISRSGASDLQDVRVRSSRFRTLPEGFLGSASTSTTCFGTLKRASCRRQWSTSSSGVVAADVTTT